MTPQKTVFYVMLAGSALTGVLTFVVGTIHDSHARDERVEAMEKNLEKPVNERFFIEDPAAENRIKNVSTESGDQACSDTEPHKSVVACPSPRILLGGGWVVTATDGKWPNGPASSAPDKENNSWSIELAIDKSHHVCMQATASCGMPEKTSPQ